MCLYTFLLNTNSAFTYVSLIKKYSSHQNVLSDQTNKLHLSAQHLKINFIGICDTRNFIPCTIRKLRLDFTKLIFFSFPNLNANSKNSYRCNMFFFIPDVLTFYTNERGNQILIHDGYRYFQHSNNKYRNTLKKRWICGKIRSNRCRACLLIVNGQIVKYSNEHNHPSNML